MIAIMVTIPIFLISLSHLAPRLGYWWPGDLSVLSRSAVRPLSPFVNIVITTARLAVEGIRAANRASKGRSALPLLRLRPFHLVSCPAEEPCAARLLRLSKDEGPPQVLAVHPSFGTRPSAARQDEVRLSTRSFASDDTAERIKRRKRHY